MTLVRIEKNYNWPLLQQTPGNRGTWQGVKFTLDPVESCDYLIILNKPLSDISVSCPPEHIWVIVQEPPNEHLPMPYPGDTSISRIFTSDEKLIGPRYVHSQPALPWYVKRDYDQLIKDKVPIKRKNLSWVTSNKSFFQGHKKRLKFLDLMDGKMEFDLFGRGYEEIKNKWDGLAQYRYSLAIENYKNAFYWSEKIADCFLTWTMPIYYGCTRISEYFPLESMVIIDIDDPDSAEIIRETIEGDRWERNIDAIEYARKLVLDKYQLFPFLVEQIHTHENDECRSSHRPINIEILLEQHPPFPALKSLWTMLCLKLRHFITRTYNRE